MILTHSGLPIELSTTDHTLHFYDGLICEQQRDKATTQLAHVLHDPTQGSDEIAFRFYQGIHFRQDRPLLDHYQLRYDITLILPGLVGKERKKTTGHLHQLLPGKRVSHAELYEVLSGTALYILQPIEDMSQAGPDMVVNHVIIVKVTAGEKIVIPANCAHCATNIGNDALVFANLVLSSGSNDYTGIGALRGMAVYVLEENGQLQYIQNPHYHIAPAHIKEGHVVPDHSLGTAPGIYTYSAFRQNPDAYQYLQDPEPYTTRINMGLKY